MSGEIFDDDGSQSLTLHTGVSDEEIRLTLANAILQNETVVKWRSEDQLSLADLWFKYIKTGEVTE